MQLERFRHGALAGDDVIAVARHLSECVRCRAAVESDTDAAAHSMWNAMLNAPAADHLREEELVAYVGGTMPRAEAEAARSHLAECEICSDDVADLERLHRDMTVKRFPTRWIPYAVAAALATVLFGVFLAMRNTAPATPVAQRPPLPPPPIAREDPVALKWRGIAAVALKEGEVEKPAIVSLLNPASEPLRGTESTNDAKVIGPVGRVVDETRPLFRWRGIPGAKAIVSVFANTDVVARSKALRDDEWQPTIDLARGVTYTWQVALTTASGRTIIPAPPDPPARFFVMSADDHEEMQDALRRIDDPLVRGVICAKFGLQERAIEELEKAGARALADSVRTWRR